MVEAGIDLPTNIDDLEKQTLERQIKTLVDGINFAEAGRGPKDSEEVAEVNRAKKEVADLEKRLARF